MDGLFAQLPSLWLALPVLAIVFAAAIVQFGLGMGFGMVAAPMLAVLDPELVPVPTLILGLATATLASVRERRAIIWSEVRVGVLGRALGAALAAAILARLTDRDTFGMIFGAMIALAVLLSVAGFRLPFTRVGLVGMAALSGLMGTITSVGAPPMAIVYQDRPGREARPTLSAFFAIGCVMSLVGLWAAGWLGMRDVMLAGLMTPGLLAGYVVSGRLTGRFDRRYRGALLAVSGLAACVLVVRGLA